jgi:hypothetical protein
MNRVFLVLFLSLGCNLQAQIDINDALRAGKHISKGTDFSLDKKWFSTAEIELLIPSKVRYNHFFKSNNNTTYSDEELTKNVSFGLTYAINYPIFNKLSLGAVTSFEHQTSYNITALKFGGKINYYFTNYENASFYLMVLHNTFSSKSKRKMGNVRLGLAFPVGKINENNLTLNLFWDHDFYKLKEPLLASEIPDSINFTSYGVSFGIQF